MIRQEVAASRPNHLGVALVTFVLWVLLILGGQKVVFPNAGNLDDLVKTQVNIIFVIAAVLLLGVTIFFKLQRQVGLKPAEPPSSWLLLWPQALFIVLILGAAIASGLPPASVVLFVLLNTMIVGVHEELMCRGILFQGLLSRLSIWQAILLTSFLFGSIHALNGFLTGQVALSLVQAVTAMMSGLWFQAVRLRTRSIYPGMLFHGLWDFAVFVMQAGARTPATTETATPTSGTIISFVLALMMPLLLVLYALWLLRGIGKQSKDEVLA